MAGVGVVSHELLELEHRSDELRVALPQPLCVVQHLRHGTAAQTNKQVTTTDDQTQPQYNGAAAQ
jgi:hypothetical protein